MANYLNGERANGDVVKSRKLTSSSLQLWVAMRNGENDLVLGFYYGFGS